MSKKKIFFTVAAVLVCLVLVFLRYAGDLLVINQKPVKSDVIIVLSGDQGRLKKGIELYNKGYAPYLMFSNGLENYFYKGAQELGVPKSSIIMEDRAKSTTDNALYTKKLMKKYGFHSAIVVSSNYHMRRVKENFQDVYKNSGIRLTYCASEYNNYNPNRWWSTTLNRSITFTEYVKMVGNFFGYNGEVPKETLRKLI
ncbi:YdcF family protein [Scopulibacillus cellulosilyticus]|uniref:YdcF family protein n=1 Tax=Scopulibacillus cellulosilyticus TaxID=2665665 RepID=A0ABW2Q3D3_9BACL